MRNLKFMALALVFFASCQPQSTLEDRLKNHINYLASDELKGREAGTEEEKIAAQYIQKEFKNIGLEPAGTDQYYQNFDFLAGKIFGDNNALAVGESDFEIDTDYFPLNFSGNGTAKGEIVNLEFGISAMDLDHDDYSGKDVEGKIALINVSSPDGIHPHSKYLKYHDLRERAGLAQSKGAIAVVFINNDETANDPTKRYTDKMSILDIPVIFYSGESNIDVNQNITMSVDMVEDRRIAQNVIAQIDNSAEQTVILGAHYDHLGYGDEGSLYRGDKPMIHNGADDNASGTSMLIEIAKEIKSNKALKSNNYLFIAFSGEEKGLLGANYFSKEPTIDLEKVTYMINMDMVGRMDTTKNSIGINGVGTSPVWTPLLDSINSQGIGLVTTESGVGPSDHTAFYLSDIPVLHFFSGTHEDYHKPSDDADKINYDGMVKVYSMINQINAKLADAGMIEFTKTKDSEGTRAPQFTVTLGVVPDYMFEGSGLKIDGVSEEKPAQVAGIQKGDIILKIGEYEISDIYAYMNSLSNFKKGQEVIVIVNRDDTELELTVNF